jgi:hypothetical protein
MNVEMAYPMIIIAKLSHIFCEIFNDIAIISPCVYLVSQQDPSR